MKAKFSSHTVWRYISGEVVITGVIPAATQAMVKLQGKFEIALFPKEISMDFTWILVQ